jgi:hypothetical protein
MFLLWGCTIIHVPLLYLLRASQEYPKHSPNPEFLARLKKKLIFNNSQSYLQSFGTCKNPPLGAEKYTHPRRADPARGSVPHVLLRRTKGFTSRLLPELRNRPRGDHPAVERVKPLQTLPLQRRP